MVPVDIRARASDLARLVTPWHVRHGWNLGDFGYEFDRDGGPTWRVRLLGPVATDTELPRYGSGDQTYGKPRVQIVVGAHGTLQATSFDDLAEAAGEWLRSVR